MNAKRSFDKKKRNLASRRRVIWDRRDRRDRWDRARGGSQVRLSRLRRPRRIGAIFARAAILAVAAIFAVAAILLPSTQAPSAPGSRETQDPAVAARSSPAPESVRPASRLLVQAPSAGIEARGRGPSLPPQRLVPRLDAALSTLPRGLTVGVAVLSERTGEILYARNANRPFTPASNQKIFTIGAALDALGSDFVFRTEAIAAVPLKNETLSGSLFLRGTGDPSLTTEGLWGLALDLQAGGLRRVRGDLILDDSDFDPVQAPAAGPGRNQGRPYGALTSALTSNFNTIAVELRPGSRPGQPARVVSVPPLSGVRILNRTRTGGVGSSKDSIAVSVRESETADIAVIVTTSGQIPVGSDPRRVWRAVPEPALLTGALFKELLGRADINIEGKIRAGVTPPRHVVLARRDSPSLAVLLRDLGKRSSNLYAEQILKALSLDRPRSTRGGLERVRKWLAKRGINSDGLNLTDGSGLSRGNRATPLQIAKALWGGASSPASGPEFKASFAIAGVDGTLKRRMSDLRGRVRGKTGYLDGVSAISGWAVTDSGQNVVFSILTNGSGLDPGAAKRLEERVVRSLVQ